MTPAPKRRRSPAKLPPAVRAALPVTREEARTFADAAKAEQCRRSFLAFARTIRPDFDIQWFHEALCHALQEDGLSPRDTRLGISMPPGHAKTEYCALFVAWMVARDPDQQIMYVTYNQDRASEVLEERIKPILEEPIYLRLFGRRINSKRVVNALSMGESNNKKKFRIVGGKGSVAAAGFGGGITGGRFDVVVIDDPFKGISDAWSPAERDKRWHEYQSAVLTRKRPGRPLRVLMPFTRWHLDDLCGRARQREPESWRWIEIEALRSPAPPPVPQVVQLDDPREEGQALWDAVYTVETLLAMRRAEPATFNALFQQRPVPEGGALFKREWLSERWSTLNLAVGGELYQSWDFRHGGKQDAGSYVVGILAWRPVHEPAKLYLLDLIRERWDPAESVRYFEAQQTQYPWSLATRKYVERKADGITILSQCAGRVTGLSPVQPSTSKEARARAAAPLISGGCLVLPATRAWVEEYVREMTLFPQAGSDDQVDATTQLINEVFGASIIDDTQTQAAHAWRALYGT